MPRAAQLAASVQHISGAMPRLVHGERSSSVLALSPLEEDFFRAGDALALAEVEDFRDLDDDRPQVTMWRALIGWLRGERPGRSE